MTDLTMPYGQYQGRPIDQVPSNYLHWLIVHIADEELVEVADAELNRRDDHFSHFGD